ncbi:RNA polymerase sigma-70 factor (ECF subfamily) [Nakamurella sp. UYEF19]|uniref:RNA polymerase sigma factor n=1 Tax=Nakamurella sp. UYEF19 TaxID=1756392 RepID=UPI003391928A
MIELSGGNVPVPAGDESHPGKPEVDESVLVLRAQKGDPRAFETLVRRYQQTMYAVALRILSDPDEAEDAAQNAFVAAWRRLPEFRQDAKFSSWMYRIVTNQALNQARGRQRQAQPMSGEDLESAANGGWLAAAPVDPEQQAEQSELLAAVHQALASLPEELRVCWLLREIEECPYQDVADITGVSLYTARGRIYRARLRLAEAMSSWR